MDKVTHFEIPADDLARAQEFYKNAFGWGLKDSGMPGVEYILAQTVASDKKGMPKELGGINGGIMKRQHPQESTVVVVTVNNLDETLAKIQENGGKVVMPKMEVGQMGLYARITDSEGNIVGVWQDVGSR